MSDPIELTCGTKVRINIAGLEYVGEIVECWKQADTQPKEGKSFPDGTVLRPVIGQVGNIKLTIRVAPNEGCYAQSQLIEDSR